MGDLYRSFVSGFCSHDNIQVTGSGAGPLAGLTFAVKDIIDVAGQTTGAGNPDWYRSHAPAARHAVAVQRLLDAGANMVGKTVTEEFAYGLIGENYHYGTPVNPRVEGGVPGGSSSGSASVVASGQVDFALGTDTGGSVRVPASFCGLYGIRPSHGRVPLDGIMPLAPSLDTCGWFARDASLLRTIGSVLLDESLAVPAQRVLLAEDAFELADDNVCEALESAVARVAERVGALQLVRPGELAELRGYDAWQSTIQVIRGSEAAASHLAWMRESDAEMGPGFRARFEAGAAYTAEEISNAMSRRATVEGYMADLLGNDAVMLVPGAPSAAPQGGADEAVYDRLRNRNELYNCTAPLGRLPQVSVPLGETPHGPVGLGLVAGHGNDEMLLDLAVALTD